MKRLKAWRVWVTPQATDNEGGNDDMTTKRIDPFATIANHAKVDDAINDQHRLDEAGVCNALVREIDGSVSVCVLAWDAEKALRIVGGDESANVA